MVYVDKMDACPGVILHIVPGGGGGGGVTFAIIVICRGVC